MIYTFVNKKCALYIIFFFVAVNLSFLNGSVWVSESFGPPTSICVGLTNNSVIVKAPIRFNLTIVDDSAISEDINTECYYLVSLANCMRFFLPFYNRRVRLHPTYSTDKSLPSIRLSGWRQCMHSYTNSQ